MGSVARSRQVIVPIHTIWFNYAGLAPMDG